MPITKKDTGNDIELNSLNSSKITREELAKAFDINLKALKIAAGKENILEIEKSAKYLLEVIIEAIRNDHDDFLRANLFSAIAEASFGLYISQNINSILNKKNGIDDISDDITNFHQRQFSNIKIYALSIFMHMSICLEKPKILQVLLSNLVDVCGVSLENTRDYQCLDFGPLYKLTIENKIKSCLPLLYMTEKSYPKLFKQGALTAIDSIHILHSKNIAAIVVPQLHPLSLEKLILTLGNSIDATQLADNNAINIQRQQHLIGYASRTIILDSFNKALKANLLLASDIAFIFYEDAYSEVLKETIHKNLADLIKKLISAAKNSLYERRIVNLLTLRLEPSVVKVLDEAFALHEAVARRLHQAALSLLELSSATLNSVRNNTTVLHLAAKSLNAELVGELIKKDADVKFALPNGITALHEIILAVIHKYAPDSILVPPDKELNIIISIIEALLSAGADINAKACLKEEFDITPLHLAIRSMAPLVVATILKSSPNINIKNSVFGTPLNFIKELMNRVQQNMPSQLLLIDFMLKERVRNEALEKEILKLTSNENNNVLEKPAPFQRFFPHI